MIPSCLFAPWVVPVLGGPGAVGLPSGALPHGLRPVSAPARLSQDKGRLGSILGLISWQLLWGNDFVTNKPLPFGLAGVSPARWAPWRKYHWAATIMLWVKTMRLRRGSSLDHNIGLGTPTGGGDGVFVLLMVTVTMLGWLWQCSTTHMIINGMEMIMSRYTGDYRYFGWEPSAQGVFGFTPPGQT